MTSGSDASEVLVVGGGIAGIACARTLSELAVPVVIRDRGHRLGGRMAVRTVDSRPIDVGAAYFTARHPSFRAVVDQWCVTGLANEWTDTFHIATPEGIGGTTTGRMRYSAPLGLRSLVEDMAAGLAVSSHDDVSGVAAGPVVDNVGYGAVALAMPGPQAIDILGDDLGDERTAAESVWQPTVSLVARFGRRSWPSFDGVFVNESPVLTFIADDGRRRGDDEPFLVAHAHPLLAAAHLDEPETVLPAMCKELQLVLGIHEDPETMFTKRWSLAKPSVPKTAPFHLGHAKVGLCGDGWQREARIESAFLSGCALGRAIGRTLGTSG